MFYRLLDILRCPQCQSKLDMKIFVRIASIQEINSQVRCSYCNFDKNLACKECYLIDIYEGLLYCSCGAAYPIINGVPRMTLDAFKSFSDFYFKYKKFIEAEIGKVNSVQLPKEVIKTQQSFAQQWQMFRYSSKTWSRTPDERRDEVLVHFNTNKRYFEKKMVLDAGCGAGIESAVITDFNAEVIGIDLSDSVEIAHKHAIAFRKENLAPVHYVQADLMKPPFDKNAFDFVTSSGVLHHTPNTKTAFDIIAALCKKGGLLWIWLYQRETWIAKTIEITKNFSRNIPLRFLYYFCYLMAPAYQLTKSGLNICGLGNYPQMTLRENVVSLSDTITPMYAFNHTPEEAESWFKEAGFKNIQITWRDRCGFGIVGEKFSI